MTETGAGNAAHVPVDGSTPVLQPGDLRLEVVPLPVTDLDRAKTFYAQRVGFVLDVDTSPRDGVRFVQLTPPGSACSIALTEGVAFTAMPPGGLRGLHLVVPDIAAARRAMIDRGVDVGPIEDVGDAQYAHFTDPDGNSWALQHMPWRPRAPTSEIESRPADGTPH